VPFGRGAIDDEAGPMEAGISDEDYDEFRRRMEQARSTVMARAPNHRALLERVHTKTTGRW
jgi:hypothetical protein